MLTLNPGRTIKFFCCCNAVPGDPWDGGYYFGGPMRTSWRVLSFLVVLFFLAGISTTTFASIHTTVVPKARVTTQVDNSKRVILHGHVPHSLRKATDMGRVDPSTPAQHLIMMLKPDEHQRRELRRIIDEQHDKRSANFHQWVTPEEFGSHFGVHNSDIAQVKAWLKSQGFTVEKVAKSGRAIQFSGTSGKIERAFQTEMHHYRMPNGAARVSNDRDITVPTALSKVIAGVPTLNNFFRKSHLTPPQKLRDLRELRKKMGNYVDGYGDDYLGANDLQTIYNTTPLLAAGINGAGVKIGIVGRSDIQMSDVQTYRQMFNLPANDPILTNVGQDAGIDVGDDSESAINVELAGALAPNATVELAIGPSDWVVDGIVLSSMWLVENNDVDIINDSYGSCESDEGTTGNAFNQQLWEQAAAQGISVFVATGDAGAAACDDSNDFFETGGYAAEAEASTWYAVGVGGTEFNEGTTTPSPYWSASNGATNGNALSYIPELPWNESGGSTENFANYPGLTTSEEDCVYASFENFVDSNCNVGLWTGSGAISGYYLQPPFQSGGVAGVPTSDPAINPTSGGTWVQSVSFSSHGTGYSTKAPTVTFGAGCTTTPTATATVSGGAVTSVDFVGYAEVLNSKSTAVTAYDNGQGWGCTSAPTITFSSGNAHATAVLAHNPPGMVSVWPPVGGVDPVTGAPNLPHRYTPDVALNAAADHDGTLACYQGVCEIGTDGSILNADIEGGTSVASPAMAGIQALIDQANGGRQGMPAYHFYQLAAADNATNCNADGSGLPAAGCNFNDVTVGDNMVCGTLGPNYNGTTGVNAVTCTSATPNNKIGFAAGTKYDMATGLGSPNAYNLATNWNTVHFNSSNTTLGLSSTSFAFGTAVTLSGTVASGSGGTPTGDVAIIVSDGALDDYFNGLTGVLTGPIRLRHSERRLLFRISEQPAGRNLLRDRALCRRRHLRFQLIGAGAGDCQPG